MLNISGFPTVTENNTVGAVCLLTIDSKHLYVSRALEWRRSKDCITKAVYKYWRKVWRTDFHFAKAVRDIFQHICHSHSLICLKSVFHFEWKDCCFTVNFDGICSERSRAFELRESEGIKIFIKVYELPNKDFTCRRDCILALGTHLPSYSLVNMQPTWLDQRPFQCNSLMHSALKRKNLLIEMTCGHWTWG